VQEEGLAALLREYAVPHSVPGAAIGILQRGSAVFACYGTADVTTGEPVTPRTRFSAGSLTKSMVATVIARLAEAGRLSLDDPVTARVPELRASSWADRATLRDLLANRSGLPLSAGLEFGFMDRTDRDDGALARLVADAADGPGGGFWSCSNMGWCVLGRVIETATGAAWQDAMRRELFGRAGMSATTFVTGAESKRRARGHEVTAEGLVPAQPLTSCAYGRPGPAPLRPSPTFSASPACTCRTPRSP
jgi:CubicO group peptidase (beta-lactamase class C family)